MESHREYTLDYAFYDAPLVQMAVDEESVDAWLDLHLGDRGGSRVMVPVWHEGMHTDADPKNLVPFYLAREGTLESREAFQGFDLLTFTLKPEPQFAASGRSSHPRPRLFPGPDPGERPDGAAAIPTPTATAMRSPPARPPGPFSPGGWTSPFPT